MRLTTTLAALFATLLPLNAPARAADAVEAFYAGRTVDFVIGSAAGGGYGVYALVLARHIGKHIPGRPNVVGRLMDGAGSLTAANQLYSRLASDGSVFGAVFTGAIVEPLIGDRSKARYDSRRFGYIGSANRETSICFAHKDANFKTWQDVFDRKLIVGGAGWTSSIRQYPAVLNTILGTKFEIISGYPGSKEAIQAVEKGEVGSGFLHYLRYGYFEGRMGALPAVDEEWYLTTYPDVAQAVRAGRVISDRKSVV